MQNSVNCKIIRQELKSMTSPWKHAKYITPDHTPRAKEHDFTMKNISPQITHGLAFSRINNSQAFSNPSFLSSPPSAWLQAYAYCTGLSGIYHSDLTWFIAHSAIETLQVSQCCWWCLVQHQIMVHQLQRQNLQYNIIIGWLIIQDLWWFVYDG